MSGQEINIRSYKRDEVFWISGKADAAYAQVYLSNLGNVELFVKGSILEVKSEVEKELNYNGEATRKNEIQIENGDTIEIEDYVFTFFDEWIEICGQSETDIVTLLEVEGEGKRFSGFPYYKRSPRVIYRITEKEIAIKAPPQKQAMTKGGIIQLIVPTLSTTAITVVTGIMMKRGVYTYLSMGMTAVTLIFSIKNFLTQRKEIKEANDKREQVYKDYILKTRKEIREKRAEEEKALSYLNPNVKAISQMVELYSPRLYERNRLDDDFLQVTLGRYAGTSSIKVSYEKDELDMEEDELKDLAKEMKKEYAKIDEIPLPVNLRQAHLGVVGEKANIHEQLKHLLLQITFFHSYHDLQIIFIHNEAYKDEFSYVKWYPHMHIHAMNVTGEIYTERAKDQILGSVQQILKDRKLKEEEEKKTVIFSPYILFIIDEPRLILNHTIMEYLQQKDMGLDFSVIYTTNQQENLPENIKTVCFIENSEEGRLLLNAGERVNQTFHVQHLTDIPLVKNARKLSAIIHDQGMRSQIPEAITFFDMYQVEHPEELKVRERWEKNESHKSLAVPLGVRAKEDYVDLNLHEKAHGPHGLVAGTTGSGKSEIVQSYILSLAVNFHPYEVGFLLIDYKGGGMANLFLDLPHLLGTITNLDKAESMRAMVSIKSELARRQQIFSDNNVNHINGYNQLFKLGKVKEPLPHLFMISDEFAELKKEQPDFMSELVSAARIGRSLGIHLILATQKPSGVVDDQIWTNSKFKLCLKVQNAGDSKEMLRTPDAANITQAGRSYLQVGNNEIYELFQSAWSGASYTKGQTAEEKEDDRVYLINEIGQGELINKDLSGSKESNQIKATQLDVVVEHIKEIYDAEQTVEIKKPWLPSLQAMLLSPHTKNVRDSKEYEILDTTLGLGVIDIPEEQTQREYILDFGNKGHMLYMASSGYGKSMFLGNMILGLAMKNSVKNLNVYILDLGNSALIAYKGLPHVADYMGFDDSEKMSKFQGLIMDMVSERKRLFAQAMTQNFNVYNQSQTEPLKAIVIAVDNYDIVGEIGDAMIAFLQKVARDGASLGIYLAITLTRENVMRGATKGNFKERIAGFNFVDGENNSFIGRSQIHLSENKKGRALVKLENINEMQLYTPVSCDNEVLYNEEIKTLIEKVAKASSEERAKGIPVLPEELHYEMLPEYPGYAHEANKLPVGIDVDTLEIKYLDLREGAGLVVGGLGSGKSNIMKTVIALAKDHEIYIFDKEDGDLGGYINQENVSYGNEKESYLEMLDKLEEIVERREEEFEEERIDNAGLTAKAYSAELEPVYIILDSLQAVYDVLEEETKFEILSKAQKYGMFIVVTSDTRIKKTTGNDLMNSLANAVEGLVLGSVRDQSVFSSTGIREDNKKLDIGYYHKRGENKKIKLIHNN